MHATTLRPTRNMAHDAASSLFHASAVVAYLATLLPEVVRELRRDYRHHA